MADTPRAPRKTLTLPVRADGETPAADARRKPVRGGAATRKPAAHPNAGRPLSAAEAAATPAKTRDKPRDKPAAGRGAAGAGERTARQDGAAGPRAPARPGAPRDGKPGGRPAGKPPAARPANPSPRPPRAAAATAAPVRPAPPKAVAADTPPSGVRVSKLMAERGLCSRREADAFIERGWVFVDGERVSELGTRTDPAAKITLAKEARANQQRQMTILLNKPVGYVSGQPEPGFTPAVALIQPDTQYRTPDTPLFHPSHLKGLAPAGRLDIDSTGLLVLTQDGRVARQLIGEDSAVDKEYLVRVEGDLLENGLALLNHGLSLDGKPLRPAKVEWLNDDQLRFVLREGKKRQIRRMCELVGLRVVGLKRIRIGGIRLGDLPVGQWRYLREDETF